MSSKPKNKLEDLIQTLKKLRSPNGCEWDKKQTHESLIPYLLDLMIGISSIATIEHLYLL